MNRLDYIKRNWKDKTDNEMAAALGIEPDYVEAIRHQNGLYRDESPGLRERWTDEEVELLKEKYKTMPSQELEKLFDNRSARAIVAKAWRLGLSERQWKPKIPNAD